MHNRVQADVFVTGGGRPSTINGSNWKDFLLPDGTPSARTIVEGANLFVTHEARQALFEHCALPIVKDSSANKCAAPCASDDPSAPRSPLATLTMLHPLGLPSASPGLPWPPLATLGLPQHAAPPSRCGVICSSMEIVAGMLLDDKEFIALKPKYVPGVLDILRSLARRDACAKI